MELLMFVGVFPLAGLHCLLLREVHRGVALVALLFRVAEALLGVVTVLLGVAAAEVAGARGAALGAEARVAVLDLLLRVRASGMDAVLVLLGPGAALFCGLFRRSGDLPGWMASYGVGCYLLLSAASFTNLMAPELARWTMLAMIPGTLFEVGVGLWLLRGPR
jgi:hypothetical protein